MKAALMPLVRIACYGLLLWSLWAASSPYLAIAATAAVFLITTKDK